MNTSLEEKIQRVKRLIDLFPNYTHNFNIFLLNNNDAIKSGLLAAGIETSITANGIMYTPAEPVGVVTYSTSIWLDRCDVCYTDYGNGIGTILLAFDPPHPDVEILSFENPRLSGLQVEIFQAIFGPDWPKYVDFSIERTQTVKVSTDFIKKKIN